ncbi:MAG TPA: hypothetical protein VMW54_11185 [Terriglobia bacterium]|nr:hypothetical protein [Terriglobia bacterium]
MANQVDDYVKRPLQYGNIDGLEELAVGLIWAGFALFWWFQEIAPSSSVWRGEMRLVLCMGTFGLAVHYGKKALKKHITYPRTGYVKYRQTPKGVWRIVAGALTAVVVALAVAFVSRHSAFPSFTMVVIALTSAGWGLAYAMLTRLDAVWRWVVLVVLVAAPPAVTMLPLDPLWRDHLPFVLQGLIFMVSGTIGLALYLRRNPLPQEDAE